MDDQEGKASDGDQPDFITGEYGFHTVDLHIDGGRLIGVTVRAEDGEIAPSELLGLPAYVDTAMKNLKAPLRVPTFRNGGRGSSLTQEDYEHVANVYLDAKENGMGVLVAVANARQVSASRAGHLIREAKEDGAFDRVIASRAESWGSHAKKE